MFKRTIKDLTGLFEPDNIRENRSVVDLGSWGGIIGLEKELHTSFKEGISEEAGIAQERAELYGRNDPITKESKTLLAMIIETFEDQMLRILCAAAVISLVLGVATQGWEKGWMEGTSILVAVCIIVTVTSGNNYLKEQQFKKLNAIAAKKNVDVLRKGMVVNTSVYDLLVGDIQLVETGQILSVDGVLIEGHDILADESSMTGEPIAIRKTVPLTYLASEKVNPFLVSGSKILQGNGRMIVLAVGEHSQYGILKKQLQSQAEETPLQLKLSVLAEQIGHVGMIAAAMTFTCMLMHMIYGAYASGKMLEHLLSIHTLNELVEAFIVAVSIIVVAVPEGLPLAVTIALAYSVGKMKDENNLVRYLQACETMGGADNICSDKTGTLTRNLMTVTRMFAKDQTFEKFDKLEEKFSWLLCTSICQNSNANPIINKKANGEMEIDQIGNKTDCALLEMAYNLGYDYKKVRSSDRIARIYPFSSEAKTMSTISNEKGQFYLFSKGAPDFLLPHCSSYLNAAGVPVPIADQFKESFAEAIKTFAAGTLRTLLLAYRECKEQEAKEEDVGKVMKNLVIIGMVGIKDPLRDAVPHAVKLCHEAGVIVRMITGDNPSTAVAIAKEAGILDLAWKPKEGDYTVMTGQDFRTFVGGLVTVQNGKGTFSEVVGNLENFKHIRDQLRVLARSSPTDKNIMATGLKQLGHVVAMTGDGTNDAPALKKADIGFAMGIAGTEVAKQAAGIILLDDNFRSIVTAIKWGRNIFDSIRKFLQFQLTVNVVALVMAFLGAAVLKESPLNPIQMLWVNLIMDTLASLALATEPPSESLLKRKPYSRREGLITASMWRNILSQSLLQIIILGTILFKGPTLFGIPSSIGAKEWTNETGKHYCLFFHTFVLLQVFNQINARKLLAHELNVFENFLNNPLFLIILVVTIVIQILCVQFGGESLKTVPLSLKEHLGCLGAGAISLLAGVAFKTLIPTSQFQFLVREQTEKKKE